MAEGVRRNLEIKARYGDLGTARQRCLEAGGVEHDLVSQVDTYFHALQGRLKMREIHGRSAQLIAYERPDRIGPRPSSFRLVELSDGPAVRDLLASSLGIRGQVQKNRRVLLWRNVRIHLDEVEQVGTFIELEAVISSDDDERESPARLQHLCDLLGVSSDETIAESYSDLLGI